MNKAEAANNSQSGKARELRGFAFTLAGGFLFLGLLLIWREKKIYDIFLLLALVFGALGLTFPLCLGGLHTAWMKLAAGLAWFNTRVILSLVFFAVFTPAGLVIRLFGRDPLNQNWKKKSESYWKPLPEIEASTDKKRYERMF